MARACTVCAHAGREAIDAALVGGAALAALSRAYRVSEDALARHREAHLPVTLARAAEAAEAGRADDLLAQLKGLRTKAVGILLAAERGGDLRTALLGIREARACLELLAEMQGEVDRRPTVNLLVAPEWLGVRAALVRALADHPEAGRAVAAALIRLEGAA